MDRRSQLHRRDLDESGVDISRLLVFAFVVAALLGLGTGVLWIAWNLVVIPILGGGA
jgi:hypothetical protein